MIVMTEKSVITLIHRTISRNCCLIKNPHLVEAFVSGPDTVLQNALSLLTMARLSTQTLSSENLRHQT